MKKLIFPPSLQPGDLIWAIAPSGALREPQRLEAGLKIWTERGYRVKLGENWNSSWGYLAGDDWQRRACLKQAWNDPECKAIVAIRGGYGGARLLENWQWETDKLKWLIGFSDVTALLWSLYNLDIGSLHAPVVTTLALEPDWSRERLFSYLERKPLDALKGEGWGGGCSEGLLLPCNLTVATHLLNTPLQPDFKGVILALEDVTEAPYRIDRMLTQWRSMGIFKQVVGIALGRFSRCEPTNGVASWTVAEVLRDRLGDLGIPIVANLPFGHDGANAALPVGHYVYLDGDQGVCKFEPNID